MFYVNQVGVTNVELAMNNRLLTELVMFVGGGNSVVSCCSNCNKSMLN